MFGTIIVDAYKKDEAVQIAAALDDLCSPYDNMGWSSGGIYSFWDYTTREVFYIGLAVDLSQRFKQHNSILHVNENSCKKVKIDTYFQMNEVIGYSIFVPSAMDQPLLDKAIKKNEIIYEYTDEYNKITQGNIKLVEGILIEAYNKTVGEIPGWNRIGGAKEGQERAVAGNYEIIRCFSQDFRSPLVARKTLRQISENWTFERYENFIHTARAYMLSLGISFREALDIVKKWDSYNYLDEIIESKYFEDVVQL